MCRAETVYLEKLQEHARDTRKFLTNEMKPERERSVCRAFLRTIEVPFEEQELVAPTDEPADVAFRAARFQIQEILEQDRRRGDDWKRKEQKYFEADSLDNVMEPYSPKTSITLVELAPILVDALSAKAQKYGTGCNYIDALVYVNLGDKFLVADSDVPNLEALQLQGWRSVSILFPPYGVLLFSSITAAEFLTELALGQYMGWQDIDSLFEAG